VRDAAIVRAIRRFEQDEDDIRLRRIVPPKLGRSARDLADCIAEQIRHPDARAVEDFGDPIGANFLHSARSLMRASEGLSTDDTAAFVQLRLAKDFHRLNQHRRTRI
jgi:hypothetical protein